ncbi:hypothetical protein FRC12_015363 [Ceratobasidium sp. 428]|nr:hypothetical protein FRC12_015363 [Ceratobasidium sp. 428]
MVETLFKFNGCDAEVVSELLCYRKGCPGRATCVCALGEDVCKSIWRPGGLPDEGETLSMFEGVFGVCQLKAHYSGKYSTKLKFGDQLEVSSYASFFLLSEGVSRAVAGPSISSIHKNSAGLPPTSATSPGSDGPWAPGPVPQISVVREKRVKSDILMPRGTSLFDAQSSYHLLLAIRDALMGIMAFTEAGKMRCDVSAYNLLLISVTKHYGLGSWLKAPKAQASAGMWNRTAKGTSVRKDTDERFSPRMARVTSLCRGPVCVVHDTELIVDEDRPEGEVRTDWTGLPTFVSAQLSTAHISGVPAARTFIHDVESLLWLLVWVVAHHSQKEDSWQINETAQEVIEELRQIGWDEIAAYKKRLLSTKYGLRGTVRKFDHNWSEQLAPVIGRLASFLHTYIYPYLETPDDSYLEAVVGCHEMLINYSRSFISDWLFRDLDSTLAKLKTQCPPIDESKL